MKFIDLSKAQDVGASCMFIEIGPFRLLIDSGLHPKKIGYPATPNFSLIEPHSLDLIILTHCHLDHLGSLPVVFKNQNQAQILASVPSISLAPRMLRNSYRVMMRQKEEDNVVEYPLYTKMDITEVERALVAMPYEVSRTFEKGGEKLEVTFYSSGHIPGAAGCLLNYKHRSIFITGDVLFEEQCTLSGAKFPKGVFDTIIMETTRGATPRNIDNNRKSEVERLIKTINHTLDRNGTCLIPVFALGRMQEILGILYHARLSGELKQSGIYCSGLGMDLVDYFDRIAKKTGLLNFRKRMVTHLKVRSLKHTIYPGEDLKEKGIYLLSSGMMIEHTPSYMAASALLDYHHNSICFVGYCDPETPGGILQSTGHEEEFVFKSMDYVAKVRATVDKFDLTGHAERDELLKFAVEAQPRAIVLTHGELSARKWFEGAFTESLPMANVINPVPGVEYIV